MLPLLEVSGLTVGIKKDDKFLIAVNDITFTVNKGEIVGLAGESGCGKTLTALSIPNLLPQAAKILNGEIIYDGRKLTSLDNKEIYKIRGKEITMIFQEVRQSLNPLIKTGVQITEILELNGNKDKDENKLKAYEILKLLGFDNPEKIYNAYPHQLSGGMCQRVMAAIAVINRPRLLLADEPSSSLDIESQERILSILTQMNCEHGMSVLIISHDLSIIRQFCSRFLVMYAGKIVEEGLSMNFFSPLHPYTKALINAIPDKSKRGTKLENSPGKVPSIEDSFCGCPFAPRCKKVKSICLETFPEATVNGSSRVYCHFPETGEIIE
ncbi:MAG: ABC transporter ATP-binding protein [Treponema sp.]|nr:ABC transporter ATP-binding protein [Treponema sp.]